MIRIVIPVVILSCAVSVVLYLTEKTPSYKVVRFLSALVICLSILVPLRSFLPEFRAFSGSLAEIEAPSESDFDERFSDVLKTSLEKSAEDILRYRFGVEADITSELDDGDMTSIRIVALRVHFIGGDLLQKAECIAALRSEFLCEVTEQ